MISVALGDLDKDCQEAVLDGFYVWKGCLPMSYSRTTSVPSGCCVLVNIVNSTDVTSATTVAVTEYTSVYQKEIIFYESAMTDPSDATAWKRIACHEMGHCLGLGHNSVSYSVMHPYVSQMADEPQYADILTINELY